MMFFRKKPASSHAVAAYHDADAAARLAASRHLPEHSDARTARAVIWTVVLALGFFVYWSALTPVHEIVSGAGVVRPKGLSTRVEHQTGGSVASVHVSRGDRVAQGDTILEFDVDDLSAERLKIESELAKLDTDIARQESLLALDLTDPSVTLDPSLTAGLDPSATEEIAYRMARIETVRARAAIARAERDATVSRLDGAREELAIMNAQLARYESKSDSGAIPLSQIENLRREALRLQSRNAEMAGQAAVQAANLAQLQSVQNELIAEYRSVAALRLSEQTQQRAAVLQSQHQIAERLRRSRVVASVSGVINHLSVQNAGEVVTAGEVIAEIIPENTPVFAEIEVPADRIGGIAPGQQARVKVLTFDFTRFGDLAAEVERISPSSFTREDGSTFFRVNLSLIEAAWDQTSAPMLPAQQIKPGMTVVADIRSGTRSVLAFLLKPFELVLNRAFTEA